MMIRSLQAVLAFALLSATAPSSAASGLPATVAARLDTSRARMHISTLASDEMRGRNTPSPELERAAEYIAGRFAEYGLEKVGGTYFHEYALEQLDLLLPSTLVLTRGTDMLNAEIKADFVPFENTGEGAVRNAPVVFAGYGITAPEYGYDDYAGIDVKGAVVLVFRGEPQNPDTTRFDGKRPTRYISNREKVRNAKKHGAVGVLVVDVPRGTKKPMAVGFPWPSLYPALPSTSLPLNLPASDTLPMLVHVNDRVATFVAASDSALRGLAAELDSTLVPHSFLTGTTASMTVKLVHKTVAVRNVMGLVRGSRYPDEYVIVGAHYDHVGVLKNVTAGADSICNGADDNASGSTGLLLAAEALGTSRERPERSVLLLAFSGEEKGLLGSKAYAEHPALPLDKCVAMVNMDMIGRMDTNTVSIGGDTRCPELAAINEEENKALARPYHLAYNIEPFFFRSDQASFALKKIPVIFYFTGEHADYHKPSDEVAKINIPDLVGVTRLALGTTWRAANLPRTKYVDRPTDH